jgi:hypothetical protein
MKKIIYLTAGLALLVGCQKEQLITTPNSTSSEKNESNLNVDGSTYKMSARIFNWIGIGNGDVMPYCYDTGGNCLPEFVVYGEVFNDLNDAITNATQADFFQQNLVTDVFDMVEASYIEDFQSDLESGDLIFILEIDQNDVNYYILIDSENASLDKEELVGELVKIVIPIKYE